MTERRRATLPMTELPVDFRAFHESHRGPYIAWSELYLSNRADAEEAVDEAFEQLYFAWAAVLQRENPNAYAWTVVKHRTIDLARARGRRPTLIDVAAFETEALRTAVDPIGELTDSMRIYQAIEKLPERQRDVLVLQWSLGYTSRETADILGVTYAAVRSTTRYARKALQQTLGLDKEKHDE